jgi:hypothetical protein
MGFLSDLIRFESSGRNVTNLRQSTSSGSARGFFQITDGTWRDFGRQVGIDFSKYPTALSAPYHLQAQVASLIPLKRWDRITLRRLSAAGHTFDVNKTLGENLAAKGESLAAGEKEAPLPAASAVVTGAGQSSGNYASPETPVPGATQPNYFPADTSPETQPGLASAFANALGGASMGGAGEVGGVGGGLPDAPLDPAADLRTKTDATNLGQEWDALQAKPPSQLADLFTLPTIGQPNAKQRALQQAQTSWI